jgi:hypothetical protein
MIVLASSNPPGYQCFFPDYSVTAYGCTWEQARIALLKNLEKLEMPALRQLISPTQGKLESVWIRES